MKLPPHEEQNLWSGACGYYLGRMTGSVSTFCDLLIREWPNLNSATQDTIKLYVEAEFKRYDRVKSSINLNDASPLGMDCDKLKWEEVRSLWLN